MNKQALQPAGIYKYFGEVCIVPRASKHEEKIIRYLLDFARAHALPAKCDDAGNVLISKPASKGMEGRPVVVLQSHMDMVCEKNSDSTHNFDTDPIDWHIENGWIKARGTTLGADCGIGIAAQLALLADNSLVHGPIECLFTVDEETGLTGASALQPGFMTGKILLNLDSEDEGELFIGCAGGIGITATFDYKTEALPGGYLLYRYTVSGLIGGHSGDDINRGRANAVKIASRFLWEARQNQQIRVSHLTGGNLHNAIAREATALIALPPAQATALHHTFDRHVAAIKAEFGEADPDITLQLTPVDLQSGKTTVIDESTQQRLLHSLQACPHGVMAMSHSMPGLVETSTNLASVKFTGDRQITVVTSQRSSVESAKYNIAHMVDAVFQLAGATIEYGEGYPGWAPNIKSPILALTTSIYQELFHADPQVKAIHAGLECGLFLEKYPELDMISFGPTIKNAHSPDEKLHIESVDKFWRLLLEVLKRI